MRGLSQPAASSLSQRSNSGSLRTRNGMTKGTNRPKIGFSSVVSRVSPQVVLGERGRRHHHEGRLFHGHFREQLQAVGLGVELRVGRVPHRDAGLVHQLVGMKRAGDAHAAVVADDEVVELAKLRQISRLLVRLVGEAVEVEAGEIVQAGPSGGGGGKSVGHEK